MISKGIHAEWYARPFAANKYHAHAVWFMRDAGLQGRLFNDYWMGNFLGYWLAPELPAFVNGSLNVPVDVMSARTAILNRTGDGQGADFESLLDFGLFCFELLGQGTHVEVSFNQQGNNS